MYHLQFQNGTWLNYNFYYFMQKLITYILSFLCLWGVSAQTQQTVTFKEIDDIKLEMTIYQPANIQSADKLPVILFFFGGGWETGNRTQFQFYALNYAQKGFITVLSDYRILSKHGTTPIESLKDAKSAVRYLKQHADELQIDTTRFVVSGGSAGGQLAAACQTNETINETTDPMEFSAKPSALILFNPVVDNSPTGYGSDRMEGKWEEISPTHNVRAPFPPTIFLLGTKDNIVPVAIGETFKQEIENVGGRCDLKLYTNQVHGFFNKEENRPQVIRDLNAFLISLGYLQQSVITEEEETEIDTNEEYWVDINFTRDKDLLNLQATPGTAAAQWDIPAYGISSYVLYPVETTKLNFNNPSYSFTHGVRLSVNTSNHFTFSPYSRIADLRVHFFNVNTAGKDATIPLLYNSGTAEVPIWSEFDPAIEIFVKYNDDASSKTRYFKVPLYLEEETQLRLGASRTGSANLIMYAVQITKMKEVDETGIALHQNNELHFRLSNRTLRIENNESVSKVAIFNLTGLQIGQFNSRDTYTFHSPGAYVVRVETQSGTVAKKMLVY